MRYIAVALGCLAVSGLAHAMDAAAFAKAKEDFGAAKSKADFTGKRLSYHGEIVVEEYKVGGKKYCLPAGTKLRGQSPLTATGVLVIIRDDKKDLAGRKNAADFKADDYLGWKCEREETGDVKNIEVFRLVGEYLVVPKKTVDELPENLSGLSYGVLAVPFKYHLRGSKEFNGGGAIGPYAGYMLESGSWGVSLEVVGFMGLSGVDVERTVDGKSVKETLKALSYGAGLIGRIRDNFQVGLILGADRVGKASKYENNGKPWLSVSIGYAFSN
jgi:hypothetical protein